MMSKCELQIELKDSTSEFSVGEKITGVVHVTVNKECQCNDLTLMLFWKTHGRGNSDTNEITKVTLFKGTLTEGEHQYAFELEAPAGPLTYHGHNINVDWHLKAVADIPWAIDPKATSDILLNRGEYQGELSFGDNECVPEKDNLANSNHGIMTKLSSQFAETSATTKSGGILRKLLSLGVILLIFYSFFTQSNSSEEFSPMSIIILLIALAVFGSFLRVGYMYIQNHFAKKKTGDVDIQLNNQIINSGENIEIKISYTPTEDISNCKLKVSLIGTEVAVSGSGTNRKSHRHHLHKSEEVKPITVIRNNTVSENFSISTEQFPGSFYGKNNSLVWLLTIQIDIPDWPDWQENQSILIN
jgi:hypothetical protein